MQGKAKHLHLSFGPFFSIKKGTRWAVGSREKGVIFLRKFNIPSSFSGMWGFFNYFLYFRRMEEPSKLEVSKIERFSKKFKN